MGFRKECKDAIEKQVSTFKTSESVLYDISSKIDSCVTACSSQKEEIDSLKSSISFSTKKESNLNEKMRQHKGQIDSLTHANGMKENEIRSRRDTALREIAKIEERKEIFQNTLGLRMFRMDEGNLSFTFTCISKSKPDEEYSFK